MTNQTTALPDLLTASYDEIKAGLDARAFSSLDLTLAYLARIEEINPILRPVLELNAYAAVDAQALDAERQDGKLRGPLHGMPILVKDTIGTARPDQTFMNTTAGSYALYGSVPAGDATVVTKLKEAGAIILGKTNVTEFSNYRTIGSDSGWSGRGGQTYGAYYEKANPSGSSSGSAVAASIGLSVATLAGETCGSIVSPSSYNNIVGIKPTPGLTSRYGAVPASSTLDTLGPMAIDVKTCATVLQAIVGKDAKDSLTSKIQFDIAPDYVKACKRDALKGVRLGVPTAFLEWNMFAILRDLGAEVIEHVDFSDLGGYFKEADLFSVVDTESPHLLEQYLSGLKSNPSGIKNIKDLIKFTSACPAEEAGQRNMDHWERWVKRDLNMTSPEYLTALEKNAYLGGECTLLGALQKDRLDAFILPSDCYEIVATAGLPMISVPCGHAPPDHLVRPTKSGNLNDEGPNRSYGISFVGPKYSEETLIGLAYAFEQATHTRNNVQPLYKPTAQLADVMG